MVSTVSGGEHIRHDIRYVIILKVNYFGGYAFCLESPQDGISHFFG
ncbi:MAG: hypothetical protein PWR06_2590 [Thermoanaerobacteraceae bacterium]|jgi:hypothetical protein|nr:hypothetical protein [Thermoanaerobacteraceae bacterium]